MLGGFLALLAAATFGLNNASVRRGVLTGSVAQGLAITVPIGVPIFLVAALASGFIGTLTDYSTTTIFLLSIAGIAHFVFGRYCNYRAIKAMGANLVGPVQQASLLLTLGLAIWLLDESLTPLRLLGIVLVVLGPAITLRRRRAARAAPAAATPPSFAPNYREGILYALGSAAGYGSSPILVRAAVDQGGLGGSLTAGLVSYTAATVVIAVLLMRPGKIQHALAVERQAAKWFTASGIFVCISQMFRYMALAVAPVSVVAPIQQTAVVFRLIFGWIINREHEVFSGWVLVGIFVSLLGAVALSVSTDFVLSVLPLPDAVVRLAHWRWP